MAGGIAHDLNNTLTPITLGLQLLRRKHPGEDEIYGRLLKSAAHGSNVIRQLLTFARGAGGERTLVRSGEILANLEALVGAMFPRNIRVQTRCAPDTRPVLGDFTHLQQVLLNLCVNSRDAMPDGGELLVAARNVQLHDEPLAELAGTVSGDFVAVSLTDTGCGIAPEALARIFDPYVTTKPGGTGLGLTICKRIVEHMGGSIWVESEPGRGSTFAFRVRFPLAAEGAARTARERDASMPAPRLVGRILVVEDNEFNQQILVELLQGAGATVEKADNGREALEVLRGSPVPFDLVLMDVQMPEMDGFEATRQIRADPALAGVPVVAMTANAGEDDRQRCLEAGMDGFESKPINPARICTNLARWLATVRARAGA